MHVVWLVPAQRSVLGIAYLLLVELHNIQRRLSIYSKQLIIV